MRCIGLPYHAQLAGPYAVYQSSGDTDTRPRLRFSKRELCGEKARKPVSLILCNSNASVARQNAPVFFPMKNFGGFFTKNQGFTSLVEAMIVTIQSVVKINMGSTVQS